MLRAPSFSRANFCSALINWTSSVPSLGHHFSPGPGEEQAGQAGPGAGGRGGESEMKNALRSAVTRRATGTGTKNTTATTRREEEEGGADCVERGAIIGGRHAVFAHAGVEHFQPSLVISR